MRKTIGAIAALFAVAFATPGMAEADHGYDSGSYSESHVAAVSADDVITIQFASDVSQMTAELCGAAQDKRASCLGEKLAITAMVVRFHLIMQRRPPFCVAQADCDPEGNVAAILQSVGAMREKYGKK